MEDLNCEKCGNPKIIYWCEECQSNSEYEKCEDCGGETELDEHYHDECDGVGCLHMWDTDEKGAICKTCGVIKD